MGLMGSLYVGTSGLQTSQNALNTTAHNMSNIDTTGYTRQQVQQGTRYYNTISKTASANAYQQIGLGVNYSNVKQIRDYFLDRTYRREAGRSAFYDTSVAAVEEVEDLFQELQGETFSESIDNLWGSVQELAKDPSNSVNQGVLVQRCQEFIERASAVYQGLCEYQDNINYKIKTQVDTINEYGERIAELNDEILKIESGKFEKANDLRDQRNQLIDELAAMGNISIKETVEGYVNIQFEGVDFVRDDSINEICLKQDEVTGFYTPYWKQLVKEETNPDGSKTVNIEPAKLFDMQQTISSDTNTDIGALKSLLFARGDHRATYQDLANEQHYETNISQSVIMNVQAEFDQLIHKVATAINGVLTEAAEKATAENPNSTYLRDSDGEIYQSIIEWTIMEMKLNAEVVKNYGVEIKELVETDICSNNTDFSILKRTLVKNRFVNPCVRSKRKNFSLHVVFKTNVKWDVLRIFHVRVRHRLSVFIVNDRIIRSPYNTDIANCLCDSGNADFGLFHSAPCRFRNRVGGFIRHIRSFAVIGQITPQNGSVCLRQLLQRLAGKNILYVAFRHS